MRRRIRTHHDARRGERGVALPFTLFAIVALLVGSAGALLIGAGDIQATRNYRGAQQVHFVAESGLTHALQNINAVGVIDYENEVVDNWQNFMGTATVNFPGMAGYSYTVIPVANPANPSQRGWIRSIANGPEGVTNTVVARVEQSNIPGTAPGAIYLANDDPTDSTFMGNNFRISGNDTNLDGTPGAGDDMPGIAARNDDNTAEAIASLGGAQLDNVQGLGYQAGPPIVPSIQTAPTGASVNQLDALVESLLSLGPPTVQAVANNRITGNEIFGTAATPQITHFTASELDIRANGSAEGYGIMIVDGDLTINGDLDFVGLVIVRGQTRIGQNTGEDGTIVSGSANVWGSLWTSNLDLTVGGSAIVQYSTQALRFADQIGVGSLFPAPVNVEALIDCQQVAAGVDGCPA